MLKNGLRSVNYRGLNYLLSEEGKRKKYTPWLGDMLSVFYDRIMEKNIFPKKFNADIELHYKILNRMLKETTDCKVLELATGSGSIAEFLDRSNRFTATDISPALLRIAKKKITKAGFSDSSYYVMDANQLAFEKESYNVCICILSLNFFSDIPAVIKSCFEVLANGGKFYGCVPVTERKSKKVTIRGTLYTVKELREIFERAGFVFLPELDKNGALLYFKAEKGGRNEI